MKNRYFGERRIKLFIDVALTNYDGRLEQVREDLADRLNSKPMYPQLRRRLERDINLFDRVISYKSDN